MSNFLDKKGSKFVHISSKGQIIYAYRVNQHLSDWQYSKATKSYRLREDGHWYTNKHRTKINEQ